MHWVSQSNSNGTDRSRGKFPSTFTGPGGLFGAPVLWSLWLKHFRQLPHRNLISNVTVHWTTWRCTTTKVWWLKTGPCWSQPAPAAVADPRALICKMQHAPHISFWNATMSPINLKHSKKRIWALSSYLHPLLEANQPWKLLSPTYSLFHGVVLWYFPPNFLFCGSMLMNLLMPIPMDADSFMKHTISFTHQNIKWWFRGLNSSCWSNYTRQLCCLSRVTLQIWRPFVHMHNFEGVNRLNIF